MQVPRSAALVAAVGLLAILPATATAKKVVALGHYTQRNLVSDQAGQAEFMDPNLVNPWGLAFGPASARRRPGPPTTARTTRRSTGAASRRHRCPMVPLIVTIPGGAPTGQVFNGSSGFMVDGAPARFIFSSEAGRITAWGMNTRHGRQDDGPRARSDLQGPRDRREPDLRDRLPQQQRRRLERELQAGQARHAFRDRRLPKKFAPFGIEAAGNRIWVTFAKQDKKAEDEIDKARQGFVDVFTKNGKLVRRFATRGPLNAPWAVVQAPKRLRRRERRRPDRQLR